MGNYIPTVGEERIKMMEAVGIKDLDSLYEAIPKAMKLKKLNIPKGLSEIDVSAMMNDLASKNKYFRYIFRGAGAYNHYIPSIVKSVSSKEEFMTAYTPYQPEISQGILQSIFEYQTMICELTGLDASNASVYDGASAAAEAVAMCRDGKRNKVFVSDVAHPMVVQTIKTYAFGSGAEIILIPAKEGKTDLEFLKQNIDDKTACVYIEQLSFYGQIESVINFSEVAHSKGAKLIMGVNPIASFALNSASECGADVAVGEGQPLGMPLSFGGPYLGFMAATTKMMRKLPGRIVGETVDIDGKRAFVLTLQAREQHIRREKASSNVCSNQALCALTANVYLTSMGPTGLGNVAQNCYSKAHYAASEISKIAGFDLVYKGAFFHEFVTKTPIDSNNLIKHLAKYEILGGYPVSGGILWCVTEVNTKAQIDLLCKALREAK